MCCKSMDAITGFAVTADGLWFATCSPDKTLKVYDVINFDMVNIIKLPFTPSICEFISPPGQIEQKIAVAEKESGLIHIFDAQGSQTELRTAPIHRNPVHIMKYNHAHHAMVSCDKSGVLEYWDPDTLQLPQSVTYKYKSETNLYEFAQKKTVPVSLEFSKDGSLFSTMGRDRHVRIFRFLTGKLYREYDESLDVASEFQKAEDNDQYKLDSIDFGRRLAVDREIGKVLDHPPVNVTFDESGNIIMYATILGIKVINVVTNKLVRILGNLEHTTRFLTVSLFQGRAKQSLVGSGYTMKSDSNDPTLFCTAYKKQRFYMFSRREPRDGDDEQVGRDVFNEKPKKEEQTLAAKAPVYQAGKMALVHTTMGDIHIKLFPDECPKTVENFVTHSRNGYFNNVIFHRVIKGFMVQTGDPQGDGTGGESIWGGEFEDEFNRNLRHDRPFTVSMANAGPNTNGSQFFITTVPTPWLDNKHTVFGRVTKGMETVQAIEKVKTDKTDKPAQDIKIINVEIF
eukprot:TRINITY_DN303_c0_g4_i1.p1 TRINITY_DN303_c0_g4~~TRINITY_DN303_c0_g4_i1.p1  ORF type:complete len:512 (-),score=85.81 TRINITY_DN303_c0_g4_i1:149-1684(-)